MLFVYTLIFLNIIQNLMSHKFNDCNWLITTQLGRNAFQDCHKCFLKLKFPNFYVNIRAKLPRINNSLFIINFFIITVKFFIET